MKSQKNMEKKQLKNKWKSALRIALLALLAVIVGVNVYTLNASHLTGNTVPMPFGVGSAVVLSGSMEPEISVGDLLIITEAQSYQVGDVVVFQDGRSSVTHRIVSISEDKVVTRWDANNTEDAPITLEQIKGKVTMVIPLIGYAINLIKTPVGTICVLALAVFLLESSFGAEKKKKENELDEIRAEIEKLKQDQ